MKSPTEYLAFNTEKRLEFINIRPKVEALVNRIRYVSPFIQGRAGS